MRDASSGDLGGVGGSQPASSLGRLTRRKDGLLDGDRPRATSARDAIALGLHKFATDKERFGFEGKILRFAK